MAYDFRAWLNVQPDDKEYSFMDCTGNCAVGQWMRHNGETWRLNMYNQHILTQSLPVPALAKSKTFGELKKALA